MINILLVEDSIDLNMVIASELKRVGYNVLSAYNGESAIEIFQNNHIDLLITDIMMPNVDGYTLILKLKEINSNLPVLIISARSSIEDKYRGFSVGTDDYLVKPFNNDELILRVGAILKRAKITSENKLIIGGAVLNSENFTVTIDGKSSNLPQKEFQILFKLLSYPDKIFTRVQLMNEFWGANTDSDDVTIYTHIHRLRDRYYNCPYFEIVTIRNLGYKAVIKWKIKIKISVDCFSEQLS